MMNQKLKRASEDFIKRQAKIISKQEGIPHHEALDKLSKKEGYQNWKHFKKQVNASAYSQRTHIKSEIVKLDGADLKRKVNPYRNLIVAATNKLIENKLISIEAYGYMLLKDQNRHLFAKLFGFDSVIIWRNIGFEEIQISVWWKFDYDKHPQVNLEGKFKENFNSPTPLAKKQHYKKIVGVTATALLETITTKHLQGIGNEYLLDVYTRKGEKAELEKLPIQKPEGFETEGKFFF